MWPGFKPSRRCHKWVEFFVGSLLWTKELTINPLLSPPEGLLISNTFEGDLIETGGLHVFNLANTMVSVLHKEQENTKWKTLVTRSYAAEDKKQFNLPAGKKTIPDQSTQSLTVMID